MNKAVQLATGLVVVILLTLAFGAEAQEDDTWFKANFTLVRIMDMESSAFDKQRLVVYRSNKSGNCYTFHEDNNRGGFAHVPCADFVSERVLIRETERMKTKIAEQTQQLLENRRKLDEAIKKYQESFK